MLALLTALLCSLELLTYDSFISGVNVITINTNFYILMYGYIIVVIVLQLKRQPLCLTWVRICKYAFLVKTKAEDKGVIKQCKGLKEP
jgi:hypothetical protein